MKKRIKSDKKELAKTQSMAELDYRNIKSPNLDSKALQSYDNYVALWNEKAASFSKKTKRPSSQETLISRSEKYVEKQSLIREHSKLHKNLSMQLLDWQGRLRQSNKDIVQERYIPVGKFPYTIYSKVPQLNKNNVELIKKPSSMYTIKDISQSQPKLSHDTYYPLQKDEKRQKKMWNLNTMYIQGFNKIKRVSS